MRGVFVCQFGNCLDRAESLISMAAAAAAVGGRRIGCAVRVSGASQRGVVVELICRTSLLD